MARSRLIHPGLPRNERLGQLTHTHRLLFAMLPMLADREGRIEDRPRRIQADLFPYDPENSISVDDLLSDLTVAGFVERYTSDGRDCIAIVAFAKYQRPHPREIASTLPPGPTQATPRLALAAPRQPVSISISDLDQLQRPVVSPGALSTEIRELEPRVLVAEPKAIPTLPWTGPQTTPEQTVAVFEHWRRTMKKDARTQLDDKRRRAINKQLQAGRTVAELCQAVDGCAASPFHMGLNDRKRPYNDVSLIFRDAAHVENFASLISHPPPSDMGPSAASGKAILRIAPDAHEIPGRKYL